MSNTQQSLQSQPANLKPRAIVPKAVNTSGVDLDNVQGDIFPTFSKKVEAFIFFTISNPHTFRTRLSHLVPHITTSQNVIDKLKEIDTFRIQYARSSKEDRRQHYVKLEQINMGLSATGLAALGIDNNIGDALFTQGQLSDAVAGLGDKAQNPGNATPDWEADFKKEVHGVVIIASECKDTLNATTKYVQSLLGKSIKTIQLLEGQTRPDAEDGHEHFGFLDGVSEPALRGLAEPHVGQLECNPGVVIFGHEGDSALTTGSNPRPVWTKEGSIMAFRKLHQKVPEFNKFLNDNPVPQTNHPELTDKERVDLMGARLVGRWKSGAPVDLAPVRDDTTLVADVDKINAFDYTKLEPSEIAVIPNVPGQIRCPFAAHIRKTAPRDGTSLGLGADLTQRRANLERSMIVRAGIPYGPEVSNSEKANNKTTKDRGLAFVCYQTELARGFRFIQNTWSSNPNFPLQAAQDTVTDAAPGEDPIIGNKLPQNSPDPANPIRTRDVTGTDIQDFGKPLELKDDFVVAKGGEYFFVPPISTLNLISQKLLGDIGNEDDLSSWICSWWPF